MNYVLPVAFILIFLYSLIKNIPAYDHFVAGAKSAFDLVLSIFPYLVAIFIFVELLLRSGVGDFLTKALSPALKFVGVPPELAELVILRPFSGSGSLGILKNIYLTYGAESYIGLCASVIVGASDTVFYVVSVYFSTTNIKRFRYLIPVCLAACACGTIVSCWLVKLFVFS